MHNIFTLGERWLGAAELATEVAKVADSNSAEFKTLYDNELSLWEKTKLIAQSIYGASDIIADKKVRNQFKKLRMTVLENIQFVWQKLNIVFLQILY